MAVSFVEYEVLCAIFRDNNWAWWQAQNVTAEHFTYGREAWKYLAERVERYGTLPDLPMFMEAFADIDINPMGVGTAEELRDRLFEEYAYRSLQQSLAEVQELAESDPWQALMVFESQAEQLRKRVRPHVTGYEMRNPERLQSYDERVEKKGLLGISTGLAVLDETLGGWEPETLATLVARSSQGKTWLLLYFLVEAWKQGKRVLMYSGEMTPTMLGFRVDSWMGHFSNLGLVRGRTELGTEEQRRGRAEYVEYLEQLQTLPGTFVVVTPKDLGGHPLSVPKLDVLMEQWQPDLVGIDQLSLLDDARHEKEHRLRYNNITADLFQLAVRRERPILLLHQANRAAETDDEEAPLMEHVADSDGILQNSSHLVTMRRVVRTSEDATPGPVHLKIAVRKNRHGMPDREVICLWDVDHGVLTPIEAPLTLPPPRSVRTSGAELF